MALRSLSVLRTNGDIRKFCAVPVRYLATKTSKDLIYKPKFHGKTMKEMFESNEKRLYEEALKDKITVPVLEDVGIISGIPEEHIKNRRVRIYCPAKNAMQSGTDNTHMWEIDFETRERWENPLIGWTSTGDPMSNLKVQFVSEKEAIAHCEKMGWEYYVQKKNISNPKPRSYGTNFAWNKRTRVSTK
ncbi:NADH:ubiquinone oxidoreductase subunit 18 [Megalopta genalis]|uniref:NADH:ubiquinone oxidoreductase subunit 18 n=1 Tax=Megalopta genalis TaxID=115081 RepID=UPI003FCFDB2D